jgi:LL-diaminopimelate aminotransferase
MYLWVRVPDGRSSDTFARRALVEQGVVIMPGSALGGGGEGFIRLALTQSPTRLAEAAKRLGALL